MKIERIATNKIKVTLSLDDLKTWNLSFESLSGNSPEAQDLFWDLIRQAEVETGFFADGSQLVVEAAPTRNEGFVMIITKLEDPEDNPFQKYMRPRVKKDAKPKKRSRALAMPLVFEFDSFENMTLACENSAHRFVGGSSLFKHNGKFYMVCSILDEFIAEDISMVMSEFASAVRNGPVFAGVLAEYGQALIAENAVGTVSKHF